ncbi:MAG TPA: SsrA-binding protein SmpB [Bacteroidia bacterium]|nr:SsrA-binding protein SmpB [Bacteroidia bacterium]
MSNTINIQNRRASFEYSFIDRYTAGIQLKGSEIKSIREGKATINDAHCVLHGRELFVKGMHIAEYKNAGSYGHLPTAERKLLLTKNELKKLALALNNKGLTIIPLKLFLNERGFAKLEIALAKGKKIHDKRDTIKKRDVEREIRRDYK